MPKYNIVELLNHVIASRFSAKQSPIYRAKWDRLGIASSQWHTQPFWGRAESLSKISSLPGAFRPVGCVMRSFPP